MAVNVPQARERGTSIKEPGKRERERNANTDNHGGGRATEEGARKADRHGDHDDGDALPPYCISVSDNDGIRGSSRKQDIASPI